jgi:hypothetical protein
MGQDNGFVPQITAPESGSATSALGNRPKAADVTLGSNTTDGGHRIERGLKGLSGMSSSDADIGTRQAIAPISPYS